MTANISNKAPQEIDEIEKRLVASYGNNYKLRFSDFIPFVGMFRYVSRNTKLDHQVQIRENFLATYNVAISIVSTYAGLHRDSLVQGLEQLIK